MEDETITTTQEEKPQVYDIAQQKWVDRPAGVEISNPTFVPNHNPAQPKKEEPAAAAAEAPKVDPPPAAPTFDKTKYEKYGIEKEEDIYKTLDTLDALSKETEELRKRPTEIPFESDTHKKLYDFLKPYPESSWQEVLKTGAEIMGMNPDEADGMKVMKEAFIINHPMVSREKAAMLFDMQESRKFQMTKPREEYEDPMQYDREKQLLEIQTEIEVDKAKKVLKDVKTKLMTAPRQDQPQARVAPAEAVAMYGREVERVLDGSNKGSGLAVLDKNYIRVKADEKGESIINIELSEDKMKELRETAMQHLNNPTIYNKSGKISNFDAAKDMLKLAFALWPEQIAQQMAQQVDKLAQIKRAEQIASTQPDKVETVQGKDVKTMSNSEQWAALAAKEKAAREQQRR